MGDPGDAAIIVEGGAMRAIFAAGVLDGFARARFFPFRRAVGASAGACLLASELAGQRGRNRRVLCGPMTRPRFLSWLRFARGGHMMDLDWLWETLDREDRLDVEAATRPHGVDFRVVVTDALTGAPAYLSPCAADLNQILKASSALPGLYRGPVRVGDRLFVDGGVGDPLPVEIAYRFGARTIMVVRTRPAGTSEVSAREAWFASQAVRRYPHLARAIRRRKATYERATAFISTPPDDCSIVEVAPPDRLRTSRTSTDQQALAADYELGVGLADDAIARWRTASTRTGNSAAR
jgi:predicted patatin/cPLA2 family phospholipase